MRTLALALAIAFTQGACVASSYQPRPDGSAKLTYRGRAKTLNVGARSEVVSPFSSGYVTLLDEEAQELADSSHTQRVTGFALSMAGLVGTITAVVLMASADDAFDLGTDDGKVYLGILIGSAVIAGIGGHFQDSAEVKLNDAINVHNDAFHAQPTELLAPARLPSSAPPHIAPQPAPRPLPPPPSTQSPAPSSEAGAPATPVEP